MVFNVMIRRQRLGWVPPNPALLRWGFWVARVRCIELLLTECRFGTAYAVVLSWRYTRNDVLSWVNGVKRVLSCAGDQPPARAERRSRLPTQYNEQVCLCRCLELAPWMLSLACLRS